MRPELNNEKSSSRTKNTLLFITSLGFFGPLIHELGHMLVVELQNCEYELNLGLNHFQGLHGSVQPFCSMSELNLILFYLMGFISVSIVAVFFIILYEIKNSIIYGSIGTGLLISIILSLGGHGDLYLAASVIGMPNIYPQILTLMIICAVSAVCLRLWEEIFNISERQDS